MDTPNEETPQSLVRSNVVQTPPTGGSDQTGMGSDLGSSPGQPQGSSGAIFTGRFPRPMPPGQ